MNKKTILAKLIISTLALNLLTTDKDWSFQSEKKTPHNIFYFLTTTMSTVGFGDITAASLKARVMVMIILLSQLNFKKVKLLTGLLTIYPLFILNFSRKEDWQTDKFDYPTMLYFTITSVTSAGHGDIHPKTTRARNIVIPLQLAMILGFLTDL